MPEISQAGLEFLIRAGHLLAGIVWIGLSWYANLIQAEYFPEALPDARADVIRKLVPPTLTWSRGAALLTFLSGVLLLVSTGVASLGWSLDIAVGALLGTLMFLNVVFVIWPQHRIACGLVVGDAALAGPRAQLASRTNVVFSLPMLLFMTSSAHLPGVALAEAAPLAVAALVLIVGVLEINALVGHLWRPLQTVRGQAGSALVLAVLLWGLVRAA